MKDIILYNKINKVESDLANFSTSFDPTTLPTNIEYVYDNFLFRGIQNSNSSSTAFSHNFTNFASVVSGSTPTYDIKSSTIGATQIMKPSLTVFGSSNCGYLTTYLGLNPSAMGVSSLTYGSNSKITFITTFSLNNYLTNRRFNIGVGNFSQSSGSLSGNGLFIRGSLDVNSGNIQYGQIKANTVTVSNSSFSITNNTRYTLKIIINNEIGKADFYINNTFLGQITIDISSNILYPSYHFQAVNSSQTTASVLFIHNLFLGITYL